MHTSGPVVVVSLVVPLTGPVVPSVVDTPVVVGSGSVVEVVPLFDSELVPPVGRSPVLVESSPVVTLVTLVVLVVTSPVVPVDPVVASVSVPVESPHAASPGATRETPYTAQ